MANLSGTEMSMIEQPTPKAVWYSKSADEVAARAPSGPSNEVTRHRINALPRGRCALAGEADWNVVSGLVAERGCGVGPNRAPATEHPAEDWTGTLG
ncbi:MAG: hypothetical protein ACXVUE_10620 [Solirubrobacteraceae bacterium]